MPLVRSFSSAYGKICSGIGSDASSSELMSNSVRWGGSVRATPEINTVWLGSQGGDGVNGFGESLTHLYQ